MWKNNLRLWPLLLLTLTGCGEDEGIVQGSVVANGKEIQEGFISFMPREAAGRTFGAPIQAGRFTARLAPGRYTLVVTGGAAASFPATQEEMKAIADEDLALRDQVPPDAAGNHREFEVKPGSQQLDIVLEYPVSRR